MRGVIGQQLGDLGLMLARMLQRDDTFQQAHARRLIDQIGLITQASLLLRQCQQYNNALTLDLTTYFVSYPTSKDEGLQL